MSRVIRTSVAATVLLGATLLVVPHASAQTISVNCDQTALQPKLNNAATGTTFLLSGTCHGQFTVAKDLTLKGNPTATLDGSSGGSTLTVTGARALHLRSLVVTGGLAGKGAGIDQEGGGLLTLDHVTVKGNEAAGATAVGAGIYARGAVVIIRTSSVLNNTSVSSGSGLAVAQAGAGEFQNGSLTISGSQIRGNKATAVSTASLAEADAGAIFAFNTTVAVTSSTFRNNVASANAADSPSAQGGALLWQQQPGDLAIADSTFTDNRAVSSSSGGTHEVDALGGALKVTTGSGGSGTSTVRITGTTFDGNQTSATAVSSSAVAEGGAVYLESGSQVAKLTSVKVLNSTLTATGAVKATARGGGIDAHGSVTLNHSTLSGNTVHAHSDTNAGGASGGGIASTSGGTTTITTSTISNNTTDAVSDNSGAGAGGGGIEIGSSGRFVIRMSTVSGNAATASATAASAEALGGGVDLENGASTTTDMVTNSTIAGNRVSADGPNSDSAGGGIQVVDHALGLRFTTIVRNGATVSGTASTFAGGGGLYLEVGTATTLEATVLALNTGAPGPNCLGTFQSNGFNLLGTTTGCTFGAAGTDQSDVTAPKLGSLADHGGPTRTVALLAGSPALNKVPTTVCHSLVQKDQRLVNRPQGPACDEGAFERKP
ncbi:MAG TPA: choice-of-anchor Q domain-containing protein [Actinomycetota bacterium]|jgi:hypothetical protein